MGIMANSEDTDDMPCKAAFHHGLHCLLKQNHLHAENYTAQLKFSTDFNMMPHFE